MPLTVIVNRNKPRLAILTCLECRPSTLEVERCRQLDKAWSKGVAEKLAELAEIDIRDRQVEVHVVEDVLRFHPQLNLHLLADGDVLQERQGW
jgi:hypothetical protein